MILVGRGFLVTPMPINHIQKVFIKLRDLLEELFHRLQADTGVFLRKNFESWIRLAVCGGGQKVALVQVLNVILPKLQI